MFDKTIDFWKAYNTHHFRLTNGLTMPISSTISAMSNYLCSGQHQVVWTFTSLDRCSCHDGFDALAGGHFGNLCLEALSNQLLCGLFSWYFGRLGQSKFTHDGKLSKTFGSGTVACQEQLVCQHGNMSLCHSDLFLRPFVSFQIGRSRCSACIVGRCGE